MILETKNFYIRQLMLSDTPDFVTFWNDPLVMKYIADGAWGGGETVVYKYIEKMINLYKKYPQFGFWALVDKQSEKVVGEVGLSWNEEHNEVETGYLLHQSYWGKGFATEILSSLLLYGEQFLKLKHIIAVAHPDNIASVKIMKKCGMTFEGTGWFHNRYSVKYGIYF